MITAHTDVVGSLVRPVALRKARDDRKTGRLSHAQFKSIEDGAVDEAVSLPEAVGLDIVTDGEMRRLSFPEPDARGCRRLRRLGYRCILVAPLAWPRGRGSGAATDR